MTIYYTSAYAKSSGGAIGASEICLGEGIPGTATGVSTVTVQECGTILRQTTFTLASAVVSVADNDTAGGSGSLKLYDFPAGVVQILGATVNLSILGNSNLTTTSAVVAALGSAAAGADDDALTLTEADIIPSTACTLTARAASFKAGGTATEMAAGTFDGSSTPLALYLNFATPDAGITASATITVTGTIRVTWINHGDF